MTRAYDELYLGCARRAFAFMLDHAVNEMGFTLEEFYVLFKVSSVSGRFQTGDCALVAGRSGAELAVMVAEECGAKARQGKAAAGKGTDGIGKSAEYWTGWALSYYQWRSGMSFGQIDRAVPIEDVRRMYSPYHEMDILQFCDEMDRRVSRKGTTETRLRYYRRRLGLSQSQLAKAADIPVRTVQQYEQRQKNINHARAEYLIRLSEVLGCREKELLE